MFRDVRFKHGDAYRPAFDFYKPVPDAIVDAEEERRRPSHTPHGEGPRGTGLRTIFGVLDVRRGVLHVPSGTVPWNLTRSLSSDAASFAAILERV